jgi:hypothetical protein
MDIPSASIPAVSSLITAIMPARCHPKNEAVGPVLRISRFLLSERLIKRTSDSFPPFLPIVVILALLQLIRSCKKEHRKCCLMALLSDVRATQFTNSIARH